MGHEAIVNYITGIEVNDRVANDVWIGGMKLLSNNTNVFRKIWKLNNIPLTQSKNVKVIINY